MKTKNSLFYIFAISFFSIFQSCVSNYMVTAPQITPNLNKEEVKLVEIATTKPALINQNIIKPILIKEENTETLATIEKEIRKSNTIDGILNEASSYLGTPYRLGGMSRRGIDCSAFVLSVFDSVGINLPRVSAAQAQEGERIEKSNIEKGDLLFFQTVGKRISHVGIVQEVTPEGEIKFIHASSSKGVTISSLNERYWGARYRFAKRILTDSEGEIL
ncbi:MAG: C40 family peptidase [Flavobacteriaceae bacterium]|nr:C40 family peptidase [Flavobacteriaceae bacterium]